MKPVVPLLAVCLLLGSQAPAWAEEESAFRKAAKQAGDDAKKMAKQVGESGKKVGKDIGRSTVKTTKTVKKEFKEDFVERKNDDPPPKKKKVDSEGRQ